MVTREEAKLAVIKHIYEQDPAMESLIRVDVENELKLINAKSELNTCYQLINAILSDYIDMKPSYRKFIAIWIIGTYHHEAFNTYPYLFFNAMRGSAKTRTLKLISSMGNKGDGSVLNNLTEATLFRIKRNTVTCIDEFEQINSKDKQTIREILNSAYKRGMKVQRMKKKKSSTGEEYVTESFEPFFPIAMANIWGVEEVLADRSITLILEKSSNPYFTKKIEDFDSNQDILRVKTILTELYDVIDITLRSRGYIFDWNDYIREKYKCNNVIYTFNINNVNNVIPIENEDLEKLQFFNKLDDSGINGRNFELMLPILLIAKIISDEVFEDILKICVELVGLKKDEEYADSKDVSMFEFVAQLTSFNEELISVKELTNRFRSFLGEQENEDRWLNEKWFGRAIKRLNIIKAKQKRFNGSYVMLDIEKAKEKLKMFKTEVKQDD